MELESDNNSKTANTEIRWTSRIYVCLVFVNHEEAFDNVCLYNQWKMLHEIKVPGYLITLIKNYIRKMTAIYIKFKKRFRRDIYFHGYYITYTVNI